ncbi:hypothetical protein EYF80_060757 [Liparis tanakae]|uniref:Uncharacterized protein n=1 Tax=Liparis tanakae TaxID=230148 RepID=A0A4Z2EK21_9TELE|nr:hypothetical protein EYF80_060757 [Liparis tanakae]
MLFVQRRHPVATKAPSEDGVQTLTMLGPAVTHTHWSSIKPPANFRQPGQAEAHIPTHTIPG